MKKEEVRHILLGIAKTAGILLLLWGVVSLLRGILAPAEDYRAFPVLGSRLFMWIVGQSHLLFAAFVLGVPMFAVVVELIGMRTKDPRYDRLAHEFTRLMALAFTITGVLGALLFLGVYFLYPGFFRYMSGVFRPTYYLYVALILGEAIYTYLYYFTWEALRDRKGLHFSIGVLWNLWGTALMFVANAWLTFQMSPAGVDDYGRLTSLREAIHNLTWMPINIHRLLANVAFGGLIVGAYAAVRYLLAKTEEEKAHYDWMGYTGNFIGAAGLIPLPFAGYWLAREVYAFNEQMGITMMGGIFSWLFIIQATLIGVLFIGANYYFWMGMARVPEGREFFRRQAVYQVCMILILFVSFAIWATPRSLVLTAAEQRAIGATHHPIVGIFGVMSAKMTVVNLIILTTFVSYLLYRRAGRYASVPWARTGQAIQAAVVLLAAAWVLFWGVYGYVDLFGIWAKAGQPPPAIVRIDKFSVWQVLAVLFAMVAVLLVDIPMYHRALVRGQPRWGQMPARSQYTLIALAVTIVLLMGLMGYLRSGLRQEWHVYGKLLDTHPGAYTPTLGYACTAIAFIALLFFGLVALIFWLGLRQKKAEGAAAAAAAGAPAR